MPLSLRRGTVTAINERAYGLVRIEVDGRACVAYPELTGPVALGDDVVVNVQAVDLGLGSGGFDVLHANLTRGLGLRAEEGAHVMKLPYTPVQFARRHAEEGADLPPSLEGAPVVALSLHSQLVPACAGLGGRAVAYVQVAGGALPVALSDSVRALRDRGLVRLAIGAGACFGGDVDCVDVYSALLVARSEGAEVVVCGIGPGVVGTASRYGHGGMAAATSIAAAAALDGRPVLALRVSAADERDRHTGLSHHSEAILSIARRETRTAWPRGCPIGTPPEGAEQVDVEGWQDECAGLPLSHMGRDVSADPWFFAAAFAAGRYARSLLA